MPDFLDIPQLAKYLDAKPGTIRSWVFKRQIPFVKIGVLVRFERAAIDDWLEDRRHQAVDSSTLAERTDVRLDH